MRLLFTCILILAYQAILSQETIKVQVLHDHLLQIHIDEGYVAHPLAGASVDSPTIFNNMMNVEQSQVESLFMISSPTDTNYLIPINPSIIYRKSKPTDFGNLCETWQELPYYGVFGCENENDHVMEHWLYLELTEPLKLDSEYNLEFDNDFLANSYSNTFIYNGNAISNLIHTNNVAYNIDAPQKFAYVYGWAGDGGALDLSDFAGNAFHLKDKNTDQSVFTGQLAFRASENVIETYQGEEGGTKNQNFNGSIVYECDFSSFSTAGSYYLSVEGIGNSFDFDISCNAYRQPFEKAMKGIYNNRSGMTLDQPNTEALRPAPHNVTETPGFAGRLKYTSTSICDVSDPDASEVDKTLWEAGLQGDLTDSYGWYQDAGDWDAYARHFKVPAYLMFTYEHFKENFSDSQLTIIESDNGIPDILDEARWLLRFYKRLKDETEAKSWTTGGVPGSRIFGDLWGSDLGPQDIVRGSWEDNDRDWYVSGEDAHMSYVYAGMTAQFQFLLERDNLTDPENIDWGQESIDAYAWASNNSSLGDICLDQEIDIIKNYASAALFRLTENVPYNTDFTSSWDEISFVELQGEDAFGAYIYSFTDGATDSAVKSQVDGLIVSTADYNMLEIGNARACRWGGNPFFPMLGGQATTPIVFEGVMAYKLLEMTNPVKALEYKEVIHNTADYFLGNNPLGMTWITGLGERFPRGILHLDSWATGLGTDKEGIVPYGPWRKTGYSGMGPFHQEWPHQWVYPNIDDWPGHERWFSQRYTALGPEYTIDQTNILSAAVYGAFSGDIACSEIVDSKDIDLEDESSLSIYPNPVANTFRIQGVFEYYDITIVNQMGQVVLQLPDIGNDYEININQLGSGSYYINILANNGSIFLRHLIKI